MSNSVFKDASYQRVIVTYHGIAQKPGLNCVQQGHFREQLLWLKENYSVVPLSEMVSEILSPSKRNVHLAAVTVDDGYENFNELALPVLHELKCHSTVFVPSDKIGGYNDWDQEVSGFHKMPIMSYEALRQLPEELVEVGSHGVSHVPLNEVSQNDVRREIHESRIELEQGIGRPVRFFAFPFGVYPFGRRAQFYKRGEDLLVSYHAACTTWWGRYNSSKDLYTLRRIGVWDCDTLQDFQDKLCGYYDWLGGKEKLGRSYKWTKSFLFK